MEVDFVTYRIAVKLKEKGFPQREYDDGYIVKSNEYYYNVDKEMSCIMTCTIPAYLPYIVAAPTIEQVLEWFRKEKNIHLIVETTDSGWYYAIYPNVRREDGILVSDTFIMSSKKNNLYKKAALAGIKYVLDKLI